MKDQYVGDVNDYAKYSLLRALSDHRIGVFWLLTKSDDRKDGMFTDYLSCPEQWRAFDPKLFDRMKRLFSGKRIRRVTAVRQARLIPHAAFFEKEITDCGAEREQALAEGLEQLRQCRIIFFDPDNGLEVPSVRKGKKYSSKYVFFDELSRVPRDRSLIIYQHFPHMKHGPYMAARIRQLRDALGEVTVFTLFTGRVCYFLVPRDNEMKKYFAEQCRDLVARWKGKFSGRGFSA